MELSASVATEMSDIECENFEEKESISMDHLQKELEQLLSPESILQDAHLASKITKDFTLAIADLLLHPTVQKWQINASTIQDIAKISSWLDYCYDECSKTELVRLNINKKRNTLIFRHLPETIDEERLRALFLTSSIVNVDDKFVSIRKEPSNTWFVELSDGVNLSELVAWLRAQTLEDVPIEVGIKSNHLVGRLLCLHDYYRKQQISSPLSPHATRRDQSPSSYSTQPTMNSNSDSASLPSRHTKISTNATTAWMDPPQQNSGRSTPLVLSPCGSSPAQAEWKTPTVDLPERGLPTRRNTGNSGGPTDFSYRSKNNIVVGDHRHSFYDPSLMRTTTNFPHCPNAGSTNCSPFNVEFPHPFTKPHHVGDYPYVTTPLPYYPERQPPSFYPYGGGFEATVPVGNYAVPYGGGGDMGGPVHSAMHLVPSYPISLPFLYFPPNHKLCPPYQSSRLFFGKQFLRGRNRRQTARRGIHGSKATPLLVNSSPVMSTNNRKTVPVNAVVDQRNGPETSTLPFREVYGFLSTQKEHGICNSSPTTPKEAAAFSKMKESMIVPDAPPVVKSLQEFPSLAMAVTMNPLQKRNNRKRG